MILESIGFLKKWNYSYCLVSSKYRSFLKESLRGLVANNCLENLMITKLSSYEHARIKRASLSTTNMQL